jgi:uncharacterized protein
LIVTICLVSIIISSGCLFLFLYMEILLICIVAFLASGLTLFSGFGLGTLLLPVFGLFFPVDIAVAMTAIVHFLNNIFKFFLFKKYINRQVLLRFGLPSLIAAIAGAILLNLLGKGSSIGSYTMAGATYYITLLKVIVGVLMIIFACFELLPSLKKLSIDAKYLPAGGLLSGFFGGLSGHQGALRSIFLLRLKLSKEEFIGTGIAIACMIDISRISVYAVNIRHAEASLNFTWIAAATVSAFAGAWLGNKLLKKITISFLQNIVAVFIILFSIALIAGLV